MHYPHKQSSIKSLHDERASDPQPSSSSTISTISTESDKYPSNGSLSKTNGWTSARSSPSDSQSPTSPLPDIPNPSTHARIKRRGTPYPGKPARDYGRRPADTLVDDGRKKGKDRSTSSAHPTFLQKFNTGLSRSSTERSNAGSYRGSINHLRANPVVSFTIPEQEVLPLRPNTNVPSKASSSKDPELCVKHTTLSVPGNNGPGATDLLRQLDGTSSTLTTPAPNTFRRLSNALASVMNDLSSQHRETFPIMSHDDHHSFAHAQTFPSTLSSPSLITVRKPSDSYFAISQLLKRKNTARPKDLPALLQRASPMDQPSSDLLGFETLPPDEIENKEGPLDSHPDPRNTMKITEEQVESVSQISESRRQSLTAEPTTTIIDVIRVSGQMPMDANSRRRSSISMSSPRKMSTVQIKSRKSVYEVIWRENETPSQPSTPIKGQALWPSKRQTIREESGEDTFPPVISNGDDDEENGRIELPKKDSTSTISTGPITPYFSQPTWGSRPISKQLRIVTELGPEADMCESPGVMTAGHDSLHGANIDGGTDPRARTTLPFPFPLRPTTALKDSLANPKKSVDILIPRPQSEGREDGSGKVVRIEAEGDGVLDGRRGSWLSVKARKTLGGWDGEEDGRVEGVA